ncbi:hypothetical protein MMC06_006170, partial [Schaereria dolodes]|nr:hypothetical protein [Schaereria dolodes]
ILHVDRQRHTNGGNIKNNDRGIRSSEETTYDNIERIAATEEGGEEGKMTALFEGNVFGCCDS